MPKTRPVRGRISKTMTTAGRPWPAGAPLPHLFEPELVQPAPRRVRARDGCGLGCALWGGRVISLPHTLAGVFLLYQALRVTVIYFAVLLAGTDVEGHI